jgi:hypothetical protein
MTCTPRLAVLLPTAALTLAAPAFADGIEDVAPDNTVMIFGVRNTAVVMERVESVFAEMEGIQDEAFDQAMEQIPADIRDLMPFGEESDVPRPTGSMGFALYPAMDDETGLPYAAFMALAEYDEANAAEAMQALDSMIHETGAEVGYTVVTRDLRGRVLYELGLPADQPADEDLWAEGGGMDIMPDPADLLGDLRKLFIVAGGTHVLAGTDLPNLEDAVRRLDGELRPVLTDNRYFRGTVAQLGTPDLYGVILTTDLLDITGGIDPMNMAQMFTPTVKALFGDVKGIGWGSSFDTAEGTYSMYMPRGKQGLPALLTKPVSLDAPPDFMPAAANGFSSLSLDLPGLVPIVDRIIQTNPLLQMQEQQWRDRRGDIQSSLQGLGPGIMIANLEGEQTVMMIQASEPEAAKRMLAEMTGTDGTPAGNGMLFEIKAPSGGAAMPMPMPIPMNQVVGVGNGYAVMGDKDLVTSALSGAAAAPLAASSDYAKARATITGEDVVAWGYAPMVDAPGTLSVWSLSSTEDGFVGRVRVLMAD